MSTLLRATIRPLVRPLALYTVPYVPSPMRPTFSNSFTGIQAPRAGEMGAVGSTLLSMCCGSDTGYLKGVLASCLFKMQEV